MAEEISEIQEPVEISEEDKLKEYNYCKTNNEAMNSNAWKWEFFKALKNKFWEEEWKRFYKIIYRILGWFWSTKEEREEIKKNIVDNKKFIEILKNIVDDKMKWSKNQIESNVINIETIIILLSNALVKEDVAEIIWMDELEKNIKRI